jgi:para-nitrobenzyl esterase
MFDTLPAWNAPMLAGGDPQDMAALASQMRDAWLAFMRHGDPNHPNLPSWDRYQVRRETMLFDQHSRLALDPAGIDTWKYWP